MLLLTLFIVKHSSLASNEGSVVAGVDIKRVSHENLAPDPSKARNGDGTTASDEVQEGEMAMRIRVMNIIGYQTHFTASPLVLMRIALEQKRYWPSKLSVKPRTSLSP